MRLEGRKHFQDFNLSETKTKEFQLRSDIQLSN